MQRMTQATLDLIEDVGILVARYGTTSAGVEQVATDLGMTVPALARRLRRAGQIELALPFERLYQRSRPNRTYAERKARRLA